MANHYRGQLPFLQGGKQTGAHFGSRRANHTRLLLPLISLLLLGEATGRTKSTSHLRQVVKADLSYLIELAPIF